MREDFHSVSHTIPVTERVFTVEFCPFAWCSSLLAYGTTSRISVGIVTTEEDDPEVSGLNFTPLKEFQHDSRVQTIAWNPDTSLESVPKCLALASGAADYKIRVFRSDVFNQETVVIGVGHTDYINKVAFEPDKGQLVASVSDDHTCRVWTSSDLSPTACFFLNSPGMSVCWHPDDHDKLLVAEKSGIIHFYNLQTLRAIMSVDACRTPLMAADWCPVDSLKVAALAGGDWLLWDISRPSRPQEVRTVHSEGGRHLCFSRTPAAYLATLGRPGNQVKISNPGTNQAPCLATLQVTGGLTWHGRLSYVAVGSDRKILVWKVDNF